MSGERMKRSRKRTWPVFYFLVCVFVYVGWWFHRCREPFIQHYSLRYLLFLGLMATLFLVPPVMRWLDQVLGRRRFRYGIVTTLIVLAGAYGVTAVYYYYAQEHLFDPFVQCPAPRFSEKTIADDGRNVKILVLGGSTTRNAGLLPEDRYPEVFRGLLQDRYPTIQIQLLNGAMEWYTTRHSLINYVTYYGDWHPDIVVVMHGINDLCRSFSPPRFAVGGYDPLWTHFYGPSIQGAKPPPFEFFWVRRFLANVVDSWYSTLRFSECDYPLDRYVSRPMFERNLRQLVRYIRLDGAAPVLITQPSLYKDMMSVEERVPLWLGPVLCDTKSGFFQHTYPSAQSLYQAMASYEEVTRQVAYAESAILVNAAHEMPKDLAYFRDDVHYTVRGARLLGEMVANKVIASGVLAAFREGD